MLARMTIVLAGLTLFGCGGDSTATDGFDRDSTLGPHLSATAGVDSVHLEWSDDEKFSSYTVFRASESNVGFEAGFEADFKADTEVLAMGLTETHLVDDDVASGTMYFYTVIGMGTSGEVLVVSNEVSTMPLRPGTGIAIRLVPSRTSGVAPLFVHFDATSTSSASTARPFHDLLYRWSFGDPNAGTWSTTGRSKNTATGGVAGHVFEHPGVYTATLTVYGVTDAASETVKITVTDPDEFFSSSQHPSHETIVVSNTQEVASGDWSGEPPGARRFHARSWSDAMSQRGPGHRILLRGGETWTASSRTVLDDHDVQIGMFGRG